MPGDLKDYKDAVISGNIDKDVSFFSKIFSKDDSIRIKKFKMAGGNRNNCALIFIDGMTDSRLLSESVIKPLVSMMPQNTCKSIPLYIEKQILFINQVTVTNNVEDMLQSVIYGEALLLIDGSREAITVDTKGWDTRSIEEPSDEKILKGPREGFEEAALHNLAMLRRKLQTPDFCCEMIRTGRRTATRIYVCYLDSLADKSKVTEIKKRISDIDIDGILDSNYIVELIRDHRFSVFKTVGNTERPDVAAARLLEGRIALIVDGTPVVITLPYLFSENFQSDEDYYVSFLVASAGRLIRYISFFLAVSIPAIYIAISSFHPELLPTSLAISVEQLRGGVPFTPIEECLIMIFVFEMLLETGIRMSESLGNTLSIVGGLVVGQAAVDARIISTPMLIVIALSGISSLMIPRLKTAVFYLRLTFVLLASVLGLFGYFIGFSIMIMHIISLNSTGVDYTVQLRTPDFQGLKDTIWRAPLEYMIDRPSFNKNIKRMKRRRKF